MPITPTKTNFKWVSSVTLIDPKHCNKKIKQKTTTIIRRITTRLLSVVEYSFTVVWVLSVVLGSFLALVVVGVLGLEVVGKMVLKVGKDVLAVG